MTDMVMHCVRTEILGYTVPYLLETLIAHTKGLIKENTDDDIGKYSGPNIS